MARGIPTPSPREGGTPDPERRFLGGAPMFLAPRVVGGGRAGGFRGGGGGGGGTDPFLLARLLMEMEALKQQAAQATARRRLNQALFRAPMFNSNQVGVTPRFPFNGSSGGRKTGEGGPRIAN